MLTHLKKTFRFEASHQLPYHDGKCSRLHGHSLVLNVWVIAHINTEKGDPKEGMGMDFADIKEVISPIVERLDHHHLGSGYINGGNYWLEADPGLKKTDFPSVPTSENVLLWIVSQLPPTFNWECLALEETCTSEARIYAREYAQDQLITRRLGNE